MRHLEIKRFETGSFKNGDTCSCLSLDDYADINTIKCNVANIGDEIFPTEFYYWKDNPYVD